MSSQIQEVEVRIEDIKVTIEDHDALNRLAKNKDFQRIIDTGYFQTKASELVIARATPALQSDEHLASNLKSIDAIGELRQYFAVITAAGVRARNDLEQHEDLREDLLVEDLNS